MGRRSTREDKTIFQLSREAAGLTREAASEKLIFISEDKIEKIESGKTGVRPDDVLLMARCYEDPMLCNSYCSAECPIGKTHVAAVREKELPQMTLEILNTVNALYAERDRLITIATQSDLPEDQLDALIDISIRLDKLSKTVDSLKLWLRKKLDE